LLNRLKLKISLRLGAKKARCERRGEVTPPGFEQCADSGGKAEAGGVSAPKAAASGEADADLAAVLAAWPRLSAEQRRDVRRLAEMLAGERLRGRG